MQTRKYRKIPMFSPYITAEMKNAAYAALDKKIIGQGETVNEFEKSLSRVLNTKNVLVLNSGTSALELAYHVLDLQPGDEVISPVFTCVATNIPLARRGVKIIFADVKDNLLMDWTDVERKITKKTKAIVNVHLFNQKNDSMDLGIPVIGDSSQYLGKTDNELFTTYSFQATKMLTTVDGGALACKKKEHYKRAKLLRWYGIDRETGMDNIDVDIFEAGYKYHMSNVVAAIGMAGLKEVRKMRKKRRALEKKYIEMLGSLGGSPFLINTNNRTKLIKKLASFGIETSLVHKRNDIYKVFGGKRQDLPNMNRLEDTYLFLPCHNNMNIEDVEFICSVVKKYI